MDEIRIALENLGLKNAEIEIYLALTRKGSLSALELSKETEIDRTTAYDITRKLIEKGIVSKLSKNKTTHFKSISPEELLSQFRRKCSGFANMIPEINKTIQKADESINCELFQGKEGLVNVIKELVLSRIDYKAIGIRKEYEDIMGYFYKQFLNKVDLSDIKETAIVEKGARFKKAKKGNYRYVSKDLGMITTVIYDSTVIFFIWTGKYSAIRVKNEEFARNQATQFDLLWASCK